MNKKKETIEAINVQQLLLDNAEALLQHIHNHNIRIYKVLTDKKILKESIYYGDGTAPVEATPRQTEDATKPVDGTGREEI